jgi:hypothetical protein
MPKRGIDADNRLFFDELVSIAASRLKAMGVIRLEDQQAVVQFGEPNKLIGVAHTIFWNGGSWSYFRCPKCGARSKKLWLVEDAPNCRRCLEKRGVRYRAAYGFGRTERLRERDRRSIGCRPCSKAARCASNLCRQTGATGASIGATALS